MKVTTDAVQVLGEPATARTSRSRYMCGAKVMQISEGTNQIQRLIISQDLARRPHRRPASGERSGW